MSPLRQCDLPLLVKCCELSKSIITLIATPTLSCATPDDDAPRCRSQSQHLPVRMYAPVTMVKEQRTPCLKNYVR